MKREDFEELLELLLDWLEAVDSPGDDGEAKHARLKAWTDKHSPRSVRVTSNRVAMNTGWQGNTEDHPILSVVPGDETRFPTLIASFDSFARKIASEAPGSLVCFVPPIGRREVKVDGEVVIPEDEVAIPICGLLASPYELQEQIKLFMPGLGEELTLLKSETEAQAIEDRGEDSPGDDSQPVKRPRNGKDKQEAQLRKLIREERIDVLKTNDRKLVEAAKAKWKDKSILARGTVSKILTKLKEEARKGMRTQSKQL